MQSFSQHSPSASLRPQQEFHSGRLLCWSTALVAVTLWGTAQIFEMQNLRWRDQIAQESIREARNASELPLPEMTKIFKEIEQRRQKMQAQKLAASQLSAR